MTLLSVSLVLERWKSLVLERRSLVSVRTLGTTILSVKTLFLV